MAINMKAILFCIDLKDVFHVDQSGDIPINRYITFLIPPALHWE